MGRRGTGKTACLNYLAQYALERGWILLSTQGLEFPNELLGFIQPQEDSDLFDQPRFTQDWFQRLQALNGDAFRTVPLKGDYSEFDFFWEEDQIIDERVTREVDTTERSLWDLVDLGSRNVADASKLLPRFIEEIYNLQADQPRVLCLIDDMNFWDHSSEFIDPRTVKPLPSRRLALVDAMAKFAEQTPPNATTAFSLSTHGFMRNGGAYLSQADEVVEMKKYTDAELLTALRHYKISNTFELPISKMDMRWVAWVKGFSGGVPGDVYHLASIL
jgi:hypothetical protein